MIKKKHNFIKILLTILFILILNSDSGYIFSQITSLVEDGDTRPSKLYKISWPPVKFAEYYIVQISEDPMFTWQEDIYQVETENNYIELLLPVGTYYLRIAGVNATGKRGYFSDVIRLIVEFRIDDYVDSPDEMYDVPESEEVKLEKDTNIFIPIANDPNESIQEDPPNIIPEEEVSRTKIRSPLVIEYPDEITANIFYYVALNHLKYENEELAVYFFEVVYAIVPDYQPQFTVEYENRELSNGRIIKYANPDYYILDEIVLNYIKYNKEYGLKMEKLGEYKKAIGYYKNILVIDPYNEEIIDRINYLEHFI